MQFCIHIDEQVPAAPQVNFRKWRIFNYVLNSKDNHLPDLFLDLVGIVLLDKILIEYLLRHVCGDAVRVDTQAGMIDIFIYVCVADF